MDQIKPNLNHHHQQIDSRNVYGPRKVNKFNSWNKFDITIDKIKTDIDPGLQNRPCFLVVTKKCKQKHYLDC